MMGHCTSAHRRATWPTCSSGPKRMLQVTDQPFDTSQARLIQYEHERKHEEPHDHRYRPDGRGARGPLRGVACPVRRVPGSGAYPPDHQDLQVHRRALPAPLAQPQAYAEEARGDAGLRRRPYVLTTSRPVSQVTEMRA